jgi:hypothetical protein
VVAVEDAATAALFQTFLPDDERYSNTIDLYDAIPKYFPRKRLKKSG